MNYFIYTSHHRVYLLSFIFIRTQCIGHLNFFSRSRSSPSTIIDSNAGTNQSASLTFNIQNQCLGVFLHLEKTFLTFAFY